MKIAIIDDEIDARIILKSYINQYMDIKQKVVEADGLKSGIELILLEQPDLIFLDIQLNDGTGFDLLNHFSERKFQIIFTTGNDDHAIKAFKYSAVDYLLKPIDPDEFNAAIQKVQHTTDLKDLDLRLQHLESMTQDNVFDKIAFSTGDGISYTHTKDIIHIEADGSYCTIHIKDKKPMMITGLIKEYEELLPKNMFYRTHKSHMVNIQHIDHYKKSEEILKMVNGQLIPLARRRKEGLMGLIG